MNAAPWLEIRQMKLSASRLVALMIERGATGAAPPVDVEGIARYLGLEIHRAPMLHAGELKWVPTGPVAPIQPAGALAWESRVPRFDVRESDAGVRQRFTIAHEIGHLMLHGIGQHFRETGGFYDESEVEANRYAAELLMPPGWVLHLRGQIGANVTELARVFDVSPKAMGIRLQFMRLM